jgi:hypothetical protein
VVEAVEAAEAAAAEEAAAEEAEVPQALWWLIRRP